jgi:hypothetical protein
MGIGTFTTMDVKLGILAELPQSFAEFQELYFSRCLGYDRRRGFGVNEKKGI